ncbi:MAG: hypothetical protein AB7P50_21495, partial [Alphaproteobacteria bacterium]
NPGNYQQQPNYQPPSQTPEQLEQDSIRRHRELEDQVQRERDDAARAQAEQDRRAAAAEQERQRQFDLEKKRVLGTLKGSQDTSSLKGTSDTFGIKGNPRDPGLKTGLPETHKAVGAFAELHCAGAIVDAAIDFAGRPEVDAAQIRDLKNQAASVLTGGKTTFKCGPAPAIRKFGEQHVGPLRAFELKLVGRIEQVALRRKQAQDRLKELAERQAKADAEARRLDAEVERLRPLAQPPAQQPPADPGADVPPPSTQPPPGNKPAQQKPDAAKTDDLLAKALAALAKAKQNKSETDAEISQAKFDEADSKGAIDRLKTMHDAVKNNPDLADTMSKGL